MIFVGGSCWVERVSGITRSPQSFNNSKSKGAVAIEAAIIVPVILLLFFGIHDISRLLYTKYVVMSALREGLEVAKDKPILTTNLAKVGVTQKGFSGGTAFMYRDYDRARSEVVDAAMRVIRSSSFSVSLMPIAHFDKVSGGVIQSEESPLAFLPPGGSAHVNKWGEAAYNAQLCKTPSGEFYSYSKNGFTATPIKNPPKLEPCNEVGNASAGTLVPTELNAYAEVPTVLFGRKRLHVVTGTYIKKTENIPYYATFEYAPTYQASIIRVPHGHTQFNEMSTSVIYASTRLNNDDQWETRIRVKIAFNPMNPARESADVFRGHFPLYGAAIRCDTGFVVNNFVNDSKTECSNFIVGGIRSGGGYTFSGRAYFLPPDAGSSFPIFRVAGAGCAQHSVERLASVEFDNSYVDSFEAVGLVRVSNEACPF